MFDTGAEASLIKSNFIDLNQMIHNNSIQIVGITGGSTKSLGTIISDVHFQNFSIQHEFIVVQEDFPIIADVLIGMDFIKEFGVTLDNSSSEIILRYQGDIQVIPMKDRIEINQSNLVDIGILEFIPSEVQSNLVSIDNTDYSESNVQVYVLSQQVPEVRIASQGIGDQRDPLNSILREFDDIFADSIDKLSINNFYEQDLILSDESPVYVRPYRVPYALREELDNQIQDLLRQGIIEPSRSPFNSPVVLVPKKSSDPKVKKYRLCVDFRQLNKKLIKDKFPIPRIEEILDH